MDRVKTMNRSRKTEIEDYAGGGIVLHAAIRGLSAANLDAVPVPGSWSIRQIVLHLMDSDLIASDRMKRVIAQENPMLVDLMKLPLRHICSIPNST